jgi:CPA1 family monovalent cation:H+ antiporter
MVIKGCWLSATRPGNSDRQKNFYKLMEYRYIQRSKLFFVSIHLALTVLISISAVFAYINHRFIRMPFVIGLFFLSTILSVFIVAAKNLDAVHFQDVKYILETSDVSGFILDIMLGFLLFAGSLHTNWSNIRSQVKAVSLFAVGGVLGSTIIIGAALFGICQWFGVPIGIIHCLIFGALISPTDPIAVLGILKKANVPEKIESTIVGESLFNDGVGVVVFIALLQTLQLNSSSIDYLNFGILFLQEAVGGIAFGLLLGFILYRMLRSIDNYEAEILLTIAFVMAGYSLSNYMHLSGALSMVVMGLFVGNYNQRIAMSDITLEYVNKFWELVDVILNAILFILIAFVLVVIDFKTTYLIIGAISVFIVLLSRVVVVYIPVAFFSRFLNIKLKEAQIVVWGGLRGGLSIALVLSLPRSEARDLLVIATYACVVFSILLQGLTIEKLAHRIQN